MTRIAHRRRQLQEFLDRHPHVKSFLQGMASMNMFPPPLPTYEEMFGTDEERLASDWQKVGQDLRNAIKKCNAETPSWGVFFLLNHRLEAISEIVPI